MRRIVVATLTTTLTVLMSTVSASALVGTAQGDTVNYKYLNVSSPDSSTCGGNWANDTSTRTYRVYPKRALDGSYRVFVKFGQGTFVTLTGPSPEACEAGTANSLVAGVHGTFHGSITMKVTGGTYNPAEKVKCTSPCLLSTFVTAAFGSSAAWTATDFYFTYATADPSACASDWTNAGTGNGGDIATSCSSPSV
jgi:hypothetical protein